MQYVDFGRTGLRVSRLGFGGIPVQRIDEPGTRAMLKAAHEAGINYIDTARAYTVSEEWIGQALEELGLRDEFILATKCRALTKAEMEAELAASLKNLRTDHIDLYQFHNPSPENLDKILAPGGAIIKQSAANPKLMEHEGRAVVFEDAEDMARRIDDEALDVTAEDILVLKRIGPTGAPGMPEAGYMPIPRKLARAGVNRLSMGVQALDDAALRFLGRDHSAAEALRAVLEQERQARHAAVGTSSKNESDLRRELERVKSEMQQSTSFVAETLQQLEEIAQVAVFHGVTSIKS